MWLIPARINHLWSKYKMDMLTKAESEEFMPWYNSKMRELQKLVNGDKQ